MNDPLSSASPHIRDPDTLRAVLENPPGGVA